MNTQLIDDLAAQAWRYANNYAGTDVMPVIKIFHRRLAELIVVECARADSEANNCDHVEGESYNWGLLNHFGVKP